MAKTRRRSSPGEFVASLERGLRVLQSFSRERSQLTLSEVAVLTERSSARRWGGCSNFRQKSHLAANFTKRGWTTDVAFRQATP